MERSARRSWLCNWIYAMYQESLQGEFETNDALLKAIRYSRVVSSERRRGGSEQNNRRVGGLKMQCVSARRLVVYRNRNISNASTAKGHPGGRNRRVAGQQMQHVSGRLLDVHRNRNTSNARMAKGAPGGRKCYWEIRPGAEGGRPGGAGRRPGVLAGLVALSRGVLEGVQEAKRPREGSPTYLRMTSEGVWEGGGLGFLFLQHL